VRTGNGDGKGHEHEHVLRRIELNESGRAIGEEDGLVGGAYENERVVRPLVFVSFSFFIF
jgi:hypothetical protein